MRRYGLAATLVIAVVVLLFGFAPVAIGLSGAQVQCGSAWVPRSTGNAQADQQCEARTLSRRLQSFVLVVAGGVVLAAYRRSAGHAPHLDSSSGPEPVIGVLPEGIDGSARSE